METNMEKECSALGGLFQAIINDLKIGVPVWEDFLAKATKLHSQLKATILATTAFLDAFQRIADLATNTRGATKDIGTALTRICLRHKAVEARMKTFTSAIMECLVLPLQDKMEEWKKTVTQLDKDHAKDYKRARQEIKKRSSDTLRLQKKVRKGKCDIQRNLDTALQDVNDKFVILEETEKHALRTALIEERSRFCLFVSYLKPVVDEEVSMLSETAHFQEIMEQLLKNTTDPFTLPSTSEQVINDIKSFEGSWTFQTPPSSPSLISSRKSSMCSISSVNSSSSGSTKCHSPSLHMRYRSHSQQPLVAGTLRLSSVSSQDSGFTSQDTLFVRPHTPPPLELIRQMSGQHEQSSISNSASSNASTPSSPYGMLPITTATWPNLQETGNFDKVPCPGVGDRPHTISTAYERGHQRPPLTIHTFEPLDKISRQVNSTPSSPQGYECKPGISDAHSVGTPETTVDATQPTIPQRAATMEKPNVPSKSSKPRHAKALSHYSPASKIIDLPDFHQPAPNQIVPQPLYVNLNEVAQRSSPDALPKQPHAHQLSNSVDGSSAYGSYSNVGDDGMSSDMLYSLENLDEATKYCTIPRYANHAQYHPCMLVKRPVSAAGYSQTGHYGTLQSRTGSLRRSGSQNHKPPPPVRRTSSITSQHALTVVQLRNTQSSQNIAGSSYSLTSSCSLEMGSGGTGLGHPNSEGSLDKCSMQTVDQTDVSPATVQISSEPQTPIANGKLRQEMAYHEESPVSVKGMVQVANLTHSAKTAVAASSPSSIARKGSFSSPDTNIVSLRKTSVIEENVAINQAVLIQSLSARIAKIQIDHSSEQQLQQQQQQQPPPPLPPPVLQQQQLAVSQQHQQRSQQQSHPSAVPQSHKELKPVVNRQQSVPVSSTTNSLSVLENTLSSAPKTQSGQPGIHEMFLQSLNAKLAHHVQKNAASSPQTTPKSQRRSSAPAETHLHDVSPLQNFKLELNAKLAQQQHQLLGNVPNSSDVSISAHSGQLRAEGDRSLSSHCHNNIQFQTEQQPASIPSSDSSTSRVRQMMANRVPYDPVMCRESLLDQIKRGATLRKASTNDRSAPKIQ